MKILSAFFLGIIQALTEFLPVSSSGHLVIFQQWFNIHEASPAFDALLHLGTALATICFYWRKLAELTAGSYRWGKSHLLRSAEIEERDRESARMVGLILLCTAITAVMALPLKDLFESLFENTYVVGVAFLVTATWLMMTRKFQVQSEQEGLGRITLKMVILIGIVQFFAITPGISRSGSTIGMALLLGLQRKKAAEFSFLISIPAVLGASLLALRDGGLHAGLPAIGVGVLSSFICGLAALWLLVLLVRRGRFYYFSYYLFPLGIFVLISSIAGRF